MPVFAVGVGQGAADARHPDHAASRRRAASLKGASLVVDVVVTQTGYAGAKVPLVVEDDGRIVSTQDITLPARRRVADGQGALQGGRHRAARVPVPRAGAGQRGSHAEQPARRAHRGRTTGARRSSTSRASRGPSRSSSGWRPRTTTTCRSCCCSGRPRRRSNAPDKYLRGWAWMRPRSCRTASRRRARSCSRTAASSSAASRRRRFTPEQQRMLEDFVDVRGGGLLVLGGARSFAEGGWAGTPLADALPVVLEPASRGADRIRRSSSSSGRRRAGRAIPPRRSPTRPRTSRRSGRNCRRSRR